MKVVTSNVNKQTNILPLGAMEYMQTSIIAASFLNPETSPHSPMATDVVLVPDVIKSTKAFSFHN